MTFSVATFPITPARPAAPFRFPPSPGLVAFCLPSPPALPLRHFSRHRRPLAAKHLPHCWVILGLLHRNSPPNAHTGIVAIVPVTIAVSVKDAARPVEVSAAFDCGAAFASGTACRWKQRWYRRPSGCCTEKTPGAGRDSGGGSGRGSRSPVRCFQPSQLSSTPRTPTLEVEIETQSWE